MSEPILSFLPLFVGGWDLLLCSLPAFLIFFPKSLAVVLGSMEEGSPSSACKQVRFSKRFRIEDACELEPSPDSVPNADLMEDLEVPLR